MIKTIKVFISGLVLCGFGSCGVLKQSPKTSFVDGLYRQKTEDKKQKVYIDIEEDSIKIYPTIKLVNKRKLDTTKIITFFLKEQNNIYTQKTSFSKYSLDIDFITIPLKYRFETTIAPQQLNANLNGAVYLGCRRDNYKVKYHSNIFNKYIRNITHYGFSFGICTGIGNTAMNPTNTNNRIIQEYDGVVWCKGITGIIAIDNFTLGLTLGSDNLLDKNNYLWIYENQPWIGLAFGLNLN